VRAAQWEEDVAREDEARVRRAARGEGRGHVVARDVSVDDVDLFLPRESRELERAARVERVTQRQREDVALRQEREPPAERRVFGERDEEFVPATVEAAREVCEVLLAPAERARRADLKNSHEGERRKAKGQRRSWSMRAVVSVISSLPFASGEPFAAADARCAYSPTAAFDASDASGEVS
jgi:hypothetical protein